MEDLSALSLETEKILHIVKDSHNKLDIIIGKYNSVGRNGTNLDDTNLLDENKFLKSKIADLNNQNREIENQKELLLKELEEIENKDESASKVLKDYEERIQELEENNSYLKNELKLKNEEIERTQGKYNIKIINLTNTIEEQDEIIKEKEEIIRQLVESDDNKNEFFNDNNGSLRSDIKLKIDQTIEKINSLIS